MYKAKINKTVIIFLLTILFTSILFPQKRREYRKVPSKRPIYFETHIFPNDSSFTCNLSYKISYNNLLFVKEDSHYSSGYSVTFEIYDEEDFVKRVIGNGEVITQTYSNTISDNIYHEGLIHFDIIEGDFEIKPSIILNNTAIEAKIKPFKLIVDSAQIYKPYFVGKIELCDSVKYQLVNFQNSVPFSEQKFDMLIPMYLNRKEKIALEILQNDKIVLEKELVNFDVLNSNLAECKGEIILNNNSDLPLIKFYKVNYINQKLVEGQFQIKLKIGGEDVNFTTPVLWYDKPKSLTDIEQAIEYLEIIGFNESADSILDLPDEEQYQALFSSWNKFDDDKSSSFNIVFNEFYSRIDFVIDEFNSLGKNDGVETDRGRTYIIYGKPDSIERTFNNTYDVVEVWDYKSINEKIYFSDKTGTGKFERIK